MSFEELCRGFKKTYMMFFDEQFFVDIKSLGLEADPNSDRIRLQQHPGSGSGFSKISGSETLAQGHIRMVVLSQIAGVLA
jgi:hypothetical protein